MLIDDGIALGVANIVADEYRNGRVVLFGSHPEFGSGLALDDVGLAATMLLNAVEWQVAVRRGTPPAERTPLVAEVPIPAEVRAADLAAIPGLVKRIAERSERLAHASHGRPWLIPEERCASHQGVRSTARWSGVVVGGVSPAPGALAGCQ